MKLSVVIPFYNEVHLVRKAVDSVVENTENIVDLEILVGNDGMLDNQVILNSIGRNNQRVTRIIKNSGPKGPGGARNAALNLASGDLIAFLDADDYWKPGKILAQLESVAQGANFVATNYQLSESSKLISAPDNIEKPIEIFLKRGIGTSTILATNHLVSQSRFKAIRFGQDIDFWYRIAQHSQFRYGKVGRPLVVYSQLGSTRNKFKQAQAFWNILAINQIPYILRFRIMASYGFAGISNHYLK